MSSSAKCKADINMRFSKTLFVDDTPLNFLIHECTDGEFIAALLKYGGGAVHDESAAPDDAIPLAGEGFPVGPSGDEPSREGTLGIDFVVACCMADTLVNFEPQFLFRAGYKYQPTYLHDLRTLRKEYAAWASRAGGSATHTEQGGAGGSATRTEQGGAGGCGLDESPVKRGREKSPATQGGERPTESRRAGEATEPTGIGKRGKLTQEAAPNSSDSDECEYLVGSRDRTPRQPPPVVPRVAKPPPVNTQQGFYTNTERLSILNYISSHDAYSQVSGRSLWQLMEQKQVCPGRSWASLREHFHRRIKPGIAQLGLDPEKLRKFRNVFEPERWKCPTKGVVSSSQPVCSSQLPSSLRSRQRCEVEREISTHNIDLISETDSGDDSPN